MVIQSDNGNEFIVEVDGNLARCQIVHGWPRHPQSQDSVERENQEI